MARRKDHKTIRGKQQILGIDICQEPKCKFKGQRAAQGVCYSRIPDAADKHIEDLEHRADEFLRDIKKDRRRLTLAQYAKQLESYLYCDWLNTEFHQDEMIRVRAENSRLRLALKKRPYGSSASATRSPR